MLSPDTERVSVTLTRLPRVVNPGDQLFLNDGIVQLTVQHVSGPEVHCKVAVGGELRSKKGLNLPGAALGISAFPDHDRACLEFALEHRVDAPSQSFVETRDDMEAVRAAAEVVGKRPFLIIAKIERLDAIRHFDEIVNASDGIMIARGDLGVEVPIEEMPMLQKQLIARAHILGKPVVTATQMLESMTVSRRPTRAEATDVANAILDGTDAVMLSGESAIDKYPVEAVAMLAKIAVYTASKRPPVRLAKLRARLRHCPPNTAADAIASIVETALDVVPCAAVFVPTQTGTTARMISRLHPSQWILALSRDPAVCQRLTFFLRCRAVQLTEEPKNGRDFAKTSLQEYQIAGHMALLVEGPSSQNPEKNHLLEFLTSGSSRLELAPLGTLHFSDDLLVHAKR